MSDQTDNSTSQMTPDEVHNQAMKTLSKDPDLLKAANALQSAVNAIDELNNEMLPMQQKGMVIPNLEQRVHAAQQALARNIDELIIAMRKSNAPDAVQVAMQVHSLGVSYFQGVFFGVHYARTNLVAQGDRTFQRMFHQAYQLLQRTQSQQSNLVLPR